MKKTIGYIALMAAAFTLSLGFAGLSYGGDGANKETAFERVMRTRTLRCAYLSRAHHFMRDTDNKTISGIDYDIMEAIGKAAHIKIEWKDEVGYGTFPELLNSGKADAFCTTVWFNMSRAQRVIAASPVFYTPLYPYVREDNHRFHHYADIDNEGVTIAVTEGTPSIYVAEMAFPRAQRHILPMDTGDSDRVLAVATGKADIVIVDEATAGSYNQHNPEHKITRLADAKPVRSFPETFTVAMNEWALREFLNAAIADLQNNGTIDRILDKYEPDPTAIHRIASPFNNGK